jgi:hypothetical protein
MRGPSFPQFAGLARRPDYPQIEGALEQSAHNNVHNWIGGNMASFDGAGFDPMFGTHHGNIDRLWEAWKAASPEHRDPEDREWRDFRFSFYGADGKVEQIRVADLSDVRRLGYRYDTLAWRSTLTAADTPEYPGGGEVVARLSLSPAQKAAVRRVAASGIRGRVRLQYTRMQLPMHPLCHRIFLLHPASATPGARQVATYSGTFTLLPIADANSGLDRTVNTQVEAPAPALAALLRGAPVQVVIVPVALKGRSIPTEPLRLEGVELLIDA